MNQAARRLDLALGLAIAMAWLPVRSLLAADSADILAEIVVTAQKRVQDIEDVPVSVVAIAAQELRDRGITSTVQLGSATPGLIVNDYGNPVITVFTLRGVQEFDFGDHQESPIAVFVDGSYVPYLSAVGTDFFDMERVEVLRGPQGTLFGRNATGGAIQLISAKPTENLTGYAQVDAGDFNERRIEAAISGPIGDGWLGRLSVLKDQHDGYFQNLVGSNPGDADNLSWRAQLFRKLSDAGELTLAVRGSHDSTSSSPYQAVAAYPDPKTGLALYGAANPAAYAAFCSSFFGAPVGSNPTDCLSGDSSTGNPFTIRNNRVGFFDRTYLGASATLNWDFGGAALTSISSYGHLKKNYGGEDSDGTSLDVLTFGQSVAATDVSEEIRLAGKSGPNDWVVGVYGLRIDGNYGTDVGFYMFDPPLTALLGNNYTLLTRTWAAFAQTEYTMAPHWSITAGLRWTEDDKNFSMLTPCTGPGCSALGLTNPAFVQGTGYNSSVPGAITTRVSGNWDGKVQFNWKPNDAVLGYVGVSRGTKAGGFNGGATVLYTVAQEIFRDEVLTDYEAGAKVKFADGRARLNASVYYYDYAHMQVFNQLGPSTVTFNDNGTAYGGEVDLQAKIAEGLEAQVGIALLRTHLDPIANLNLGTGDLVYSAEELPNSPHATLDARIVKSWSVGPGQVALEADGRWVGAHKLSLIDNPATDEPAHSTVDARLSYVFGDHHWEIAAYARNLTNERYRVAAASFVGTNGAVEQIYAPPRTVGGSVRVNF